MRSARPAPFTLRLQPHRHEIRSSTDDLLALALRLREPRPVAVRGVAMTALLLTRGASPLDPNSGASLRQAVRAARTALDVAPHGAKRETPVVRRVPRPALRSHVEQHV